MKIRCLIIIFFFISTFSYSKPKCNKIFPKNIIDISIEGGLGIYIGDYRQHLINDGAYTITPAIDLYISLFIIKYLGIQAMLGSGCIIHPYSQPVEGTVLYMALEFFAQYDWKYVFAKIFAGAGFEHTTMLIQWYASGFFECGTGLGVKITDWMYWNTSVKFRMGFLHSVIIFQKYSLPNNDRLASITISTGIVFRIKNPYINK